MFEKQKTFFEDHDFIQWRIDELEKRRKEQDNYMEVKISPEVMGKDVKPIYEA